MSDNRFEIGPKIVLGFDKPEQAEKYFKGSSYTRIMGCNGCVLDKENEYSMHDLHVDRKNSLLFETLKYLQSVSQVDGINSHLRVKIAREVDEWAKTNKVETNVSLEEYDK